MESARTCASCGNTFDSSGESGAALCVACAFAIALESGDEATLTSDAGSSGSGGSGGVARDPGPSEAGERIGPYRLRRLLGEGGMGHVYEAIQDEPVRRRVALKRIKLGMDGDQVLERFESERQALALMSHPNVARVYDAGSSPDGRPFFVMDLIEGPWLTRYCDERRFDVASRVGIFLDVCRGVEHAHQKGVIHRDMKPSNVLVSTEDGRPVPKIIDFGVAKAIGPHRGGKRHMTRIGHPVGTPEYMSPEQAGPASFDVDTRTDVYALGVILYELLTGRLPLESSRDGDDLGRRILEEDPPPPSARVAALRGDEAAQIARRRGTEPPSLARALRGDLDWITMKALEKDRARRYGSPSELAADLLRHLADQPVLAGPPSAAYRAGKFVRRHRIGVGAAAAGLVVLVGFAISMAVQARRIAREREASERVSEFLASVIGNIKPHALGAALWKDLHESVARVHRARGSSPSEIDAAQAALDASLAGVGPTDTAQNLLDGQVLARAGDTIARDMANQPRIAGRLEQTLAETYHKLGLYAPAEAHALRAVETRTAELGEDAPDTLQSRNTLGTIYAAQGRYADAEKVLLDTLERQRRVLGADDPATLMSMNNLGAVYRSQARRAEAEKLLKETIDARRRVLGDDHIDTLKSMLNLGTTYYDEQRFDDAVEVLTSALERVTRLDGSKGLDRLPFMNNLANTYQQMGRNDEAEALHSRKLEISRRVLGAEHPDTLRSMNNLANVYWFSDRLEQARVLLEEVLALRRRVLRADHPETLSSMHNLAGVLRAQKRYDDAERHYHEALEGRMRVLTADHPLTLDDIYAIGCVAALKGEKARALEWLTRAVDHGYKDHRGDPSMLEEEDLASLRGDPAFVALAARTKNP